MSPVFGRFTRTAWAIIACAAMLVGASGARAAIYPAASGEPAYTKATSNNSYWYTSNGYNGNTYEVKATAYKDGSAITAPGYGQQTTSANATDSFDFQTSFPSVPKPLTDGHAYGICASGWVNYSGTWAPAIDSGTCGIAYGSQATTVIDRSAPQIAVAINGTDTYANKSPLNVTIQYADAISPPWPNSTAGLGANSICFRTGGNPQTVCNGQTYNYNPACSTLAQPRNQNTSFSCTINVDNTVADGAITLCAVAADSAFPDNPNNANQAITTTGQGVSSTDANNSAPACGWVYLDRTAPQLSMGGPATATVGQLVSLTAGGTDALSGLSNAWTWNYGDNTAETTGAAGSHTFTQAGTYLIKLTSKDNAGNSAQATKTITVAPATATPTPTPTPTPAPTGSTGGTGGTGTGGTETPAPPATSNTTGGTVTSAPSAAQVTQAAGATATTTKSSGALDVLGPKTVTIGKKKLTLSLTSDTAGKVQVTLIRNGTIRSKGSVTLKAAGTLGFSLKLPAGLAAGTYDLRIVLTPAGGGKPSTVKLKVKFAKATKKATAKAARAGGSISLDTSPPRAAPTADLSLAFAH